MEHFRIADINLKIEWEDEIGKQQFYSKNSLAFHPAFFGAFVLSEQDIKALASYDLHLRMAKVNPDLTIPDSASIVHAQHYYKENGNFCISIIQDTAKRTPIWTLKTSDSFQYVEIIPHSEEYNSYSLAPLEVAFQQMMPLYNGVIIHGAGIEYQGSGIIFSAFSGVGKTTQARLWRKYRDAIVINGDCPIIRNTSQGSFMYGSPWCGTSGESINKKTPLKAIVLVHQSQDNYVEEVTGDDAFFAVYTNILYYSQDEKDLDALLPVLSQIISQIKVYKLYCNMEEDAVTTLEKALQNR